MVEKSERPDSETSHITFSQKQEKISVCTLIPFSRIPAQGMMPSTVGDLLTLKNLIKTIPPQACSEAF